MHNKSVFIITLIKEEILKKMRNVKIINLIIFFILHNNLYSQFKILNVNTKHLLIKEKNCKLEKDFDNIRFIKNDTLEYLSFISKETEIKIKKVDFENDVVLRKYSKNLILNGFISCKLIENTINFKNYKRKKKLWKSNFKEQNIKITNLNLFSIENLSDQNNKNLSFKIKFHFYPKGIELGLPEIIIFNLTLESDLELTDLNEKVFFSNSKIKCLEYIGIEI